MQFDTGKLRGMLEDMGMRKTAYRKKVYIRLDDDTHKRLRMKVANEATTIQNYIVNLITQSLR
jgi:predicted HicB family RNase H-like nuclease